MDLSLEFGSEHLSISSLCVQIGDITSLKKSRACTPRKHGNEIRTYVRVPGTVSRHSGDKTKSDPRTQLKLICSL